MKRHCNCYAKDICVLFIINDHLDTWFKLESFIVLFFWLKVILISLSYFTAVRYKLKCLVYIIFTSEFKMFYKLTFMFIWKMGEIFQIRLCWKMYIYCGSIILSRLSVKPITNENVYVFNVHASVCLNGGDCSIDIPILSNTRLPTIIAINTEESKSKRLLAYII